MVPFLIGCALISAVLCYAFVRIILPRRLQRRFRLMRFYYRGTWIPWSRLVRLVHQKRRRERLLSFYGPLSLLGLLALWAAALMVGFAMLHYGSGSHIKSADEMPTFALDLYLSGTTFVTLGLGDVTPASWLARALTVVEAGLGFGFLAIVVGYLPVIYQAFSRREVIISMLEARAGWLTDAAGVLRRQSAGG